MGRVPAGIERGSNDGASGCSGIEVVSAASRRRNASGTISVVHLDGRIVGPGGVCCDGLRILPEPASRGSRVGWECVEVQMNSAVG